MRQFFTRLGNVESKYTTDVVKKTRQNTTVYPVPFKIILPHGIVSKSSIFGAEGTLKRTEGCGRFVRKIF